MKVKVNVDKWLDDHDRSLASCMRHGGLGDMSVTWWGRGEQFEEVDVTFDELKAMISKGYAIKINC